MTQASSRNTRALIIGAVLAAAILLYAYVADPWLTHWHQVRRQLTLQQNRLHQLGLDDDPAAQARWKGVLKCVPTFAGPAPQDTQRLLFKKTCNDQLKKAGIDVKKLDYIGRARRQRTSGYGLLRLQCRGKCKQDQVLAFLAHLHENPYLASLEALQVKVDPKKREQMEIVLTLSTPVDQSGI